jgi:hypothetical protein
MRVLRGCVLASCRRYGAGPASGEGKAGPARRLAALVPWQVGLAALLARRCALRVAGLTHARKRTRARLRASATCLGERACSPRCARRLTPFTADLKVKGSFP